MNRKSFLAGLITATILTVSACGDSDDEQLSELDTDKAAAESSIDLSGLPDDFPRELIPPEYDRADYVDLRAVNGTRTTAFESTAHVQGSIDFYVGLLGEPTINVDAGDGDRLVQWHNSPYPPWVVGVMGNAGETIVSVSTMPEE